MIGRHALSDVEREFVRPVLPMSLRGRKRLDGRRVLNGIASKFRAGAAWRDVPERYGPWATLHTHFRRWAMDGTFDRMMRAQFEGNRFWFRRHRVPHTVSERPGQARNHARRGSTLRSNRHPRRTPEVGLTFDDRT
ncbi:hypothetical protein SUDANB120_00017 [Streptomyces sp. enrichment culture]